ncbi:MAG: beta-ketoacyl-ACP reductase [Acidimicrobiia bacterium]|nr:beta-ketoacyl-ACP reductase [Acidimicrobiia bacterium]
MTLDGKVALVTGGTRGIGAAISEALAAEGAQVVAGCTSKDKAAAFYEAADAKGLAIDVAEGNVGVPEDCERVVNEAVETFGRLDILVNNAGITVDRTVRKMTVEDWHAVLRVNLSGTFYMCKSALEYLVASGAGRIINISSVIGETGNFGQANYAASKSGQFGLTKSLALEYASKGVTVNAITPGFIDTEMMQAIPEAIREQIVAKIPVGRFGRPEEIARAVKFLAEDDAGYITGSILSVNGGLEMQ